MALDLVLSRKVLAPVPLGRYVREPKPIYFPASKEMPETNRHMELRTALYLILKHELGARATIGSDQFIYYNPQSAKLCLAPDAFVKLGQPHETFRLWKTWERGAPDLAIEVVSDSDVADEPWSKKLDRYARSGIREVVRFDPDDGARPIRVWDHLDGDLVERGPAEDGSIECACLGLYWVAVPHPSFSRMLRLARDREGRDLLPTPEEAALRARQEEARARQEEARARQEEARAKEEEARAREKAEKERDALAAELSALRKQLEGASSQPKKRRSPRRSK